MLPLTRGEETGKKPVLPPWFHGRFSTLGFCFQTKRGTNAPVTAHSPAPRSKDFQGVQPNAGKFQTSEHHKGLSWNGGAAAPPLPPPAGLPVPAGTGNDEKTGHKNTPETERAAADPTGHSPAPSAGKPRPGAPVPGAAPGVGPRVSRWPGLTPDTPELRLPLSARHGNEAPPKPPTNANPGPPAGSLPAGPEAAAPAAQNGSARRQRTRL